MKDIIIEIANDLSCDITVSKKDDEYWLSKYVNINRDIKKKYTRNNKNRKLTVFDKIVIYIFMIL